MKISASKSRKHFKNWYIHKKKRGSKSVNYMYNSIKIKIFDWKKSENLKNIYFFFFLLLNRKVLELFRLNFLVGQGI